MLVATTEGIAGRRTVATLGLDNGGAPGAFDDARAVAHRDAVAQLAARAPPSLAHSSHPRSHPDVAQDRHSAPYR